MRVVIGIDPGAVSAAYAILTTRGRFVHVDDIPVLDKMLDAKLFASHLDSYCAGTEGASVILEHVSAMPGQGVSSTFRFGVGFGILQGICGAFDLPVTLVRPRAWKGALGLNSEAETSLAMARELYPDAAHHLKRKKDHNRAEAILLAHYGLRALV